MVGGGGRSGGREREREGDDKNTTVIIIDFHGKERKWDGVAMRWSESPARHFDSDNGNETRAEQIISTGQQM